MATYPSVNAANQYARDIVSGKISSCIYVKQSCQRHLDDLQKAKEKRLALSF